MAILIIKIIIQVWHYTVSDSVKETRSDFNPFHLSRPLFIFQPIPEFTCVPTLHEAANGSTERKWSWKAVRQGAVNDHIW